MRRLVDALEGFEYVVWVDWHDIQPASEWWADICSGIEAAQSYLFIITPDCVSSPVCRKELAHAVSHNKRIIPVLFRRVEHDAIPEALRALNWIFFDNTDGWDASMATLKQAIETDLDWVRAHTRLEVRAVEWDVRGRKRDFTLQGNDLKEAKALLAKAGEKEPPPTVLQHAYMAASDKAEKRRRRLLTVTPGIVILFLVALFTYQQWLIQQARALSPMVEITGGEARIGPDPGPSGAATLSFPVDNLLVDVHEVSNSQYCLCTRAIGGCSAPTYDQVDVCDKDQALYPVTEVTLDQARYFCEWIGRRLPTEIEWEWFAGTPDHLDYPTGNTRPTPGEYNLQDPEEGPVGPWPIDEPGSDQQESGLLGLVGSVREWTTSRYLPYDDPRYRDKDISPDMLGPGEGFFVTRGGSWRTGPDSALVALRYNVLANEPRSDIGFRCVTNTGKR